MLQIVKQRQRHTARHAGQEDRRSGNPHNPARDVLEKSSAGMASRSRLALSSARPWFQVVSSTKIAMPMVSGNQPPCRILVELAPKNARSTTRKKPISDDAQPDRPAPQQAHDQRDQHGIDDHRAGHRDAVGRGQVARRLEAQHERHHEARPSVQFTIGM